MQTDFDSLLSEGRKLVRKEKTAPEALRNLRLEAERRAEERARKQREATMWRPCAFVVFLDDCKCRACGSEDVRLANTGIEQYQNSSSDTRTVMGPATSSLPRDLPRKVVRSKVTLSVCLNCLDDFGFTTKELHNGT
jgi:hypothetical protein